MMRTLRNFIVDRRGMAALEFALIAPLLAGLIVVGADGWLRTSQMTDMRSALQSGMRYYQLGGSDDPSAQALTMRSWAHAPSDGAATVARSCMCGTQPVACSVVCAGSNPPTVYVTLITTGTFTGLLQSQMLAQNEVLRVR